MSFSPRRLALVPAVWGLFAAIFSACGPGGPDPVDPKDAGTDAPLDPPHCTFETPPAREAAGPIAAGPVRAGLGSRVLPMPIGAPLGGYGARLVPLGGATSADARHRRFTKSFVPSVGLHDAPRADALAIEAGGERFVLVRVDAPLVNENSLFALEAAIAPDGSMRGRVLLSASHSHASWAGWQTSLVLMPGMDLPNRHLADRMIGAMAEAAKEALSALAPAKIGFAVDPAFDPDDTVNRDRREENDAVIGPDGNTAGKGKDPVVWVMRVDRADGTPLVAVVDLPMHGTVGGEANPLVSTDVTGAVQRALSAELGYPVLHVQGAAGDVSPAGATGRAACPDDTRCLDMPRLETLGARAAALVAPLVKGVETADEAALEVVTRTFPVRRSAEVKRPDGTVLRYAPADPDVVPDGRMLDESGKAISPIDEFNTDVGAGLCGTIGAYSLAPIPGATLVGPYSSCIDLAKGRDIVFGLFDLTDDSPLPLCDTVRATATAVRVAGVPGGPFLLLSAPGEVTAPYAAYLRSQSPAGPDRTLLVGYADDYVGYLLTAEDWIAGGYECSTNVWGPLEGEIVHAGLLAVADVAWTPEKEDPEASSSRFVDWQFPEPVPIEAQVTTDHGTLAPATPSIWWPDTREAVEVQAGAPVPRAVGAARLVWLGGDPAVDLPEVTVEREAAPGRFEPLVDGHGRPASSHDGAVVVTYTPEPLDDPAPKKHVYAAVWQPVPPDPFSFGDVHNSYSLTTGNYRLRVEGTALTGAGPTTYEVVSPPFEVTPAPLAEGSAASKNGAQIDVVALLGSAPGLRALREGPSDTGVPLPGPWKVTVTFASAAPDERTVTPDASGHAAVMLTAAEVADAVSIDVRDPHGNGGALPL